MVIDEDDQVPLQSLPVPLKLPRDSSRLALILLRGVLPHPGSFDSNIEHQAIYIWYIIDGLDISLKKDPKFHLHSPHHISDVGDTDGDDLRLLTPLAVGSHGLRATGATRPG